MLNAVWLDLSAYPGHIRVRERLRDLVAPGLVLRGVFGRELIGLFCGHRHRLPSSLGRPRGSTGLRFGAIGHVAGRAAGARPVDPG